jgi:hypothetical protein
MANKVYRALETAIIWKTSAGTAVLTMTSLANNAGRIGAQVDRGAGSSAARYLWRLRTKLGATTTSVVLGNTLSVYLATSDDGTVIDGAQSTADAALSSLEKRRNLQFLGVVEVDKTAAAGDQYIGSGICEIANRYISPVIINEVGNTLSATATDHEFDLIPIPDEVQ